MALIETRLAHERLAPRSILAALHRRLELWRTRRALAKLDDHLLEDIGVTPEAARREAERAVWDVPQTWVGR